MTDFYIDCEWNGEGGALISIAIYPWAYQAFYEVILIDEDLDPWVKDHVIPVLKKEPISYQQLQNKLAGYLNAFKYVHIIADWPEDISRFCMLLITGPGIRLSTPPLSFEILRVDAPSELPHNALCDAKGLMEYAMENLV